MRNTGNKTMQDRFISLLRGTVAHLTPALAFLLALFLGLVLLAVLGANPWIAFVALVKGAFGSPYALSESCVKATPLLLVGLGICIAFRAGVLNIGGEGQMVMGGLASTAVALYLPTESSWLLISVAIIAGAIAGGVWGGIAGYLKAYLNVSEVLSTVMLNYIAVYVMNLLLKGPMIDPAQLEMGSLIPQTARIPRIADLPRLIPTRLHLGALLAVVFALLVYVFLWRTTIGFRLRTVGQSPRAALGAGINVKRFMANTLLWSGSFAGLAGAVEVLGVQHRMFTDSTSAIFTGSAGFNGIVAALFGQLHPLGAIPASLLLGGLLSGGNVMQRMVQVPSALIGVINGLIVLFVVGSEILRRRQFKRLDTETMPEDHTLPQAQTKEEVSR